MREGARERDRVLARAGGDLEDETGGRQLALEDFADRLAVARGSGRVLLHGARMARAARTSGDERPSSVRRAKGCEIGVGGGVGSKVRGGAEGELARGRR